MWPFKPKAQATAMSGIAECDGKHHVWGRWELYTLHGTAYNILFPKGAPYTETIQRRQCIICGFTEEQKVKGE